MSSKYRCLMIWCWCTHIQIGMDAITIVRKSMDVRKEPVWCYGDAQNHSALRNMKNFVDFADTVKP